MSRTTWLVPMKRANNDEVFYAIADPTRRAILDCLRGGPADSGMVAANFPLSWPAISPPRGARHSRPRGFARLIERAGMDAKLAFKAHPHMLRHACSTAAANQLIVSSIRKDSRNTCHSRSN